MLAAILFKTTKFAVKQAFYRWFCILFHLKNMAFVASNTYVKECDHF